MLLVIMTELSVPRDSPRTTTLGAHQASQHVAACTKIDRLLLSIWPSVGPACLKPLHLPLTLHADNAATCLFWPGRDVL